MTLAEDHFASWQGPTAPTKEKNTDPLSSLRTMDSGDDSADTPNYADDILQRKPAFALELFFQRFAGD